LTVLIRNRAFLPQQLGGSAASFNRIRERFVQASAKYCVSFGLAAHPGVILQLTVAIKPMAKHGALT
jgi:hypothetical protein